MLSRGEPAGGSSLWPQAGCGEQDALGAAKRAELRWSLDFVSEVLRRGRYARILRMIHDYSRECVALVADTTLSGVRVARELTWRIEPFTGSL